MSRGFDRTGSAALLLFLIVTPGTRAADGPSPQLLEVHKIWDAAPHNAFTGLARCNGQWFCVFREAASHVAPGGRLRVIESADGLAWASAAVVAVDGADLRDPKLCVTPDGRLMMVAAAAHKGPDGRTTHRSMAWFSGDGRRWDGGHEVGEPDFWLWRVTWHAGSAYGVGYATSGPEITRLYQSRDGTHFDVLVPTLAAEGQPNEHDLAFLDDGTCLCLLRRDKGTKTGLLGTARPPYRQWAWKDLGVQIGGPAMVRTPGGRLLAAVRLYDGRVRTSLCWVDPAAGKLEECLPLPSGGDTSYAGMVVHDGLLWVSYYSSHEGKTAIYLAKVKVP